MNRQGKTGIDAKIIAALRAEFHSELAAHRVQTDSRFAELIAVISALQRKNPTLEVETDDDDLESKPRPWPPGNWQRYKVAAAYSGYSESGIRVMVRRGDVDEHRRGGKVFVDLDAVLRGKKCEKK